jgi:hypothetical protein
VSNANPELVKVLDFILNRSHAGELDAVVEAVKRRKQDIALFGDIQLPDPQRMAASISSQLDMKGAIAGMEKQIRDYAIRIIKQEAPELTEAQINQLTKTWLPDPTKARGAAITGGGNDSGIPSDVLASMINQFVSFSLGTMEPEEDAALRKEMGPWPDKYWKAFPQVIRLYIRDYLKGELSEADFNSRIGLALKMG